MQTTQQKVSNSGNFNLFVAPQSTSQALNPLFTLEPCSTTHAVSNPTRPLTVRQRGPVAPRQEVAEQTERTGMRQEGGSLLSRLKQEAEGIRRWQMSMDMELKNKGEHIRDMTSLVEEQRKSLLEVQLEYEKVSGLLQEERGNQEQLGKQLTQTRDLFSAVKENVERIEDEVRKGGDDSNDLSQFQDQLISRYEELRESFLLLQNRCEEVNRDLLAELRASREECAAVRDKNDILIEETAKLRKDISDRTQMFEESLENLSADLCQKENTYSELTRERDSLSSQLIKEQGELQSVATECQQLNIQLTERARELGENKEETELLKSMYNELTAELATVRSERENLQATNASLLQQASSSEDTQSRLEERLSVTENKLTTACKELADRDGELSAERESCETARERVSQLESERAAQEDRLRLNREELLVANDALKQMEQERTDLSKQIIQLQDSLDSTNAEFEETRAVLNLEISNQKELVARAELEREDTRRLLSLSGDANNKLTEDMETSVRKCEETQNLLNTKAKEAALVSSELNTAQLQISSTTAELQTMSDTVENMRLEKASLIEIHSKQLSDLESLRFSELSSHSEELSRIKARHETQLRTSIETIDKHTAEMVVVTMDNQKLLNQKLNIESELTVFKEQSLSDKQQLGHARAVAAESQEQSSKRVSEMLDSLCKYKKESQDILSAKNKEIEELRMRQATELQEEVSKVSLQFQEELTSVRNEKRKLETLLSNIQKEKRQETPTAKRSINSTPKRPESTNSYSLMRTPRTPLTSHEPLPHQTPAYKGVPSSSQVDNATELRQTGECTADSNFRTPSIHPNPNLKQKRKKIRLDDVSMEILNSQDELSSKQTTSSRQRPTRTSSTPSRYKENIPPASYANRTRPARHPPAKSKLSKEYNWFDNDMVFGLGTAD